MSLARSCITKFSLYVPAAAAVRIENEKALTIKLCYTDPDSKTV